MNQKVIHLSENPNKVATPEQEELTQDTIIGLLEGNKYALGDVMGALVSNFSDFIEDTEDFLELYIDSQKAYDMFLTCLQGVLKSKLESIGLKVSLLDLPRGYIQLMDATENYFSCDVHLSPCDWNKNMINIDFILHSIDTKIFSIIGGEFTPENVDHE